MSQSNTSVATFDSKTLRQSLWNMAWPVVALNLLQVANSLIDRFFIGHLPESAMSAHGASMSFIFLLFSLAYSIAIGAGAIVARAYGAKEVSEYRLAAQQSLQVAIYVGFGISLLALLLTPFAARLIFRPDDTEEIRQLTLFLSAYSLGVPAICLVQALASSLRSIGDTKSPMFLSGFQILCHLALNYLLIFPPKGQMPGLGLGLLGAGFALSGSAWIAAIIYVLYVSRTTLRTRFTIRLPKKDWFIRILKIAVPSAIQAALRTFSLTAFTIILSGVPNHEIAIAAMGTGFAVESLMFAQAFGVSAAVGALVGQNLGAKQPDHAERIGWMGGWVAFLIAVLVSLPVYIYVPSFAPAIVGHKADVAREVVSIVRWLCVTEPLFCLSMVLIGGMQGAGDTKRPLWIGVIALWGMRVPIALVLSLAAGSSFLFGTHLPFGAALGATGAWIAMSATQGVQGLMAAFAWKQGKWKSVKV
jgi:putative MATE family efflux protein